jgi:signal transduction histidine kinase
MFTLLLREIRLNERQSNFVSAVTHELKTPVSSLRLYLDTLEMRAESLSRDERDDFYRTMRTDLDRLNGTINSVLNAAMYTDRPVRDPKPIDFAHLVQRAIELTRKRNQLPDATVRYRGPERLTLRGDAIALETAVLNLLDNAVKYSIDRERIDVAVTLEATPQSAVDDWATLTVTDKGLGMTRANLRLIFSRFFRIGSEVRRTRTGTGLGLFIVKSVVKGHGGTILADSAGPNMGSTFALRLPRVMREAAAAAPPGTDSRVDAESAVEPSRP